MPALVVVVEELADLLMVQDCDRELVRLAQIGRAAGLVSCLSRRDRRQTYCQGFS